jgi:hypothetical protein
VPEDDPQFLEDLDNVVLPLRLQTSEIARREIKLRKHLARHPNSLRPHIKSIGSPEGNLARHLLAERREREDTLGDLFGEPAWDMLLDLFAAHEEQVKISVSSLCIAAAVPSTTALRWISVLHERGHLIRRGDPRDGRRVWVELSPATFGSMKSLLRSWLAGSG